MKKLAAAALAAALLAFGTPATATAAAPDRQEAKAELPPELKKMMDSLNPVSGEIVIDEADAVLHLGNDYYFLPAAEAKRVLVEGWGNPPDSVDAVLGIVFPAGKTFLDDTWGAVVTWEPTGYVSDEDAQSADYEGMIKELQAGEAALNQRRSAAGYPAQHLVGWAQHPAYDAKSHSIVWAQNISFAGDSENTLNYDIRLLGRRGVLSLNMITVMPKLAETRSAAAKFAAAAEFRPGARYADYKPGTDLKAEYGVAGLVAAGVGATAAKKLGLLAVILAFGKKFFILIVALAVGLGAWVKRRFFGDDEEAYEEYRSAYEEALPEETASAEAEVPLDGEPGEPRPSTA